MKAAIHYVVRVKVIVHNKDTNEIDFEEFERKFENENPILAREDAFDDYKHNIKNFLLGGENKEYKSDRQARQELKSFIDLGNKTKFKFGEKEVEFVDSFANGIGIIMVIDNPKPDTDNKIGDEFFIHGIESIGLLSYDTENSGSVISNLTLEFDYYRHYNYETKNKAIEVIYCDRDEWEEGYRDDEPFTYNILETPFDWEGYGEPYWWGEPEESGNEQPKAEVKETKTYERLIQGGESNKVEFKTNLLYYHDNEGINSGYRRFVQHIIAKVICSFLNSNGGNLFIGVGDKQQIQGLQNDFSLARPEGKDPKDYFLLQVDKLIRNYFKGRASNISGEFTPIDGVEIFVFTVFPSKNHPVFIKDKSGNKEFYVRLTTSCEPYTDIEDIATYCIDKWGK